MRLVGTGGFFVVGLFPGSSRVPQSPGSTMGDGDAVVECDPKGEKSECATRQWESKGARFCASSGAGAALRTCSPIVPNTRAGGFQQNLQVGEPSLGSLPP